MASIVIDVERAGALAALAKVGSDAELNVWAANVVTGERIVGNARMRVRVRFGFLRAAIDWVQSPKTGDVYVGIARKMKFTIPGTRRFSGKSDVAIPAKYAHLVERGTKRSKAFAFLGPASAMEQTNHLRRVRVALEESIAANGLGD